ncbi:MAG: hypothetical protein C4320_04060 [Armatimonadota bacterium]
MLIVIIIIAVLAAIAIPKFANSSQKSKESALRANLKVVRNAVEMFKQDTGLNPVTITDVAANSAPATGNNGTGDVALSNWKGPYVASMPKDPVSGNDFGYTKTTGAVLSSATGNDSNGVAFSSY